MKAAANNIQGSQAPSQQGSWTWQCHPRASDLKVMKDTMRKEVTESPSKVRRVIESRQCVAWQSLHEGPKRARGHEKPLYESVKVNWDGIEDPKMTELWDICQGDSP